MRVRQEDDLDFPRLRYMILETISCHPIIVPNRVFLPVTYKLSLTASTQQESIINCRKRRPMPYPSPKT